MCILVEREDLLDVVDVPVVLGTHPRVTLRLHRSVDRHGGRALPLPAKPGGERSSL